MKRYCPIDRCGRRVTSRKVTQAIIGGEFVYHVYVHWCPKHGQLEEGSELARTVLMDDGYSLNFKAAKWRSTTRKIFENVVG